MSDRSLRDQERRHQTTGSVEDHAAWVRGRLRASEVDPKRLCLACALGSEVARRLPGVEPPEDSAGPLHVWLTGERWGAEVLDRAVLAAAQHLLECLSPQAAYRGILVARVEELKAWFFEQDPAAAERLRATWTTTRRFVSEHLRSYAEPGYALLQAYALVAEGLAREGHARWALQTAEEASSGPALRVAVADDLVPWLLGDADPLRARVLARAKRPGP